LSPSARYWARDVVTPEWMMNAAGLVPVPASAPGLGVEVDTDFVQSLTSRSETLETRAAAIAVG
jgi:o-succinylbenzoate synthase